MDSGDMTCRLDDAAPQQLSRRRTFSNEFCGCVGGVPERANHACKAIHINDVEAGSPVVVDLQCAHHARPQHGRQACAHAGNQPHLFALGDRSVDYCA